jgi:hypothetical protein
MSFSEKLTFLCGMGRGDWRYFPEKSTNPENVFIMRLFGDGSVIAPQELASN